MRSLILLLPSEVATPASELAYVLSDDGRSEAAHASAPAALLPAPSGAGAEVVAVVPAQALSWHRVDLPRGISASSPRLRAVLAGLLEDRLLDDADTLHFALQPRPPAGAPAWVAVCSRSWLRAAVQLLESVQRPATRIVPELWPDEAAALYAMGDADRASLAVVGPDGVLTLPLASGALAVLPPAQAQAPVVAEPAVAAVAEQLLQRSVTLQTAPQRWMQAAQSGWDLAQADFSSSGRARTFKKMGAQWSGVLRAPQWRPARIAAALLLAVNLIGLNASAFIERRQLEARRGEIRATLTQTFPQVRVVVDAPLQMEREVALLRQSSGATSAGDLEAMLSALSTVVPGRTVTAVEFGSGELRVKGLPTAPEQSRAVVMDLKSRGYAVQVRGDTLALSPGSAP